MQLDGRLRLDGYYGHPTTDPIKSVLKKIHPINIII